VLVVDNHSTDDTATVVREAARNFPVELRYVYEATEGKYAAMNTAIQAARGEIIAATDDDALVNADWLEQAGAALDLHQCDFVGGPVSPLWEEAPPAWLDLGAPSIQKVLALLDYGDRPREFGVGIGWPLGVNVAYRRDAFLRAGLFDPSLGRKAGTLRSQAQREWHLRARTVGCRGFYAPAMHVHHRVEAARLEKSYFRRWHYWHGISRARLYWRHGFDPEEPEQIRYEQPLPAFLGVPRPLIRKAATSFRSYVWRVVRGQSAHAFAYELWLCFFAGLCVESRRTNRGNFSPITVPPDPAAPETKPKSAASRLNGRSSQALVSSNAQNAWDPALPPQTPRPSPAAEIPQRL
jgi:glycosyltransferase involved in cell wall biosynthesis